MVSSQGSGKPTTRRYSPEEKAGAVRMVRTLRAELGAEHGTVHRVATQLAYGVESARTWVKQADIDDGTVAGATTVEALRVRELEQEVRELRCERDSETGGVFLRGGARPPTPELVAFIDANKNDLGEGRPLGVEPICAMLQVAPSTYYAAKDRAPSAQAVSDAALISELVGLWNANYTSTCLKIVRGALMRALPPARVPAAKCARCTAPDRR